MATEKDVKETLGRFAQHRNSTVVALLLPVKPLMMEHLERIRPQLHTERADRIDLLVHSGGGDINAAYQLIQFLRAHSESLCVVVPEYAKSAATLLCLGGDNILMDELAELGPLDTQIVEKGAGGRISFTSALNPFKALEQLRRFSLETLDLAVKLILSRSQMAPAEAVEHATKFVSGITGPLFQQLNPEKLGEYTRALSVGIEYGRRLLQRYSSIPEEDRYAIVDQLVHGYPSHDYVIDYLEAKELGLPVCQLSGKDRDICTELLRQMRTVPDDVWVVPSPPNQGEGDSSNGRCSDSEMGGDA